ncbi:MAG TPA: hypothetical protein PK883_10250, partial [Anaerolineaceae bacterium]|nr:hypothetical protein [Anaerolineaceae bacterium]
MAEDFSLRCYCFIDRMQAQYAAFVGTITQGDLPVEGMAALYVEMAPGNEVFRVVDIAVKATESKPGAQIVEREFGMFEVHSLKLAVRVGPSGNKNNQIIIALTQQAGIRIITDSTGKKKPIPFVPKKGHIPTREEFIMT